MAKQQPKKEVSDSVISVLLPTRGRREVLKTSVQGLVEKANQKDKIEILFGIDEDDEGDLVLLEEDDDEIELELLEDDKKEELSPAQKKMDKNDNGKIDGEDLAKLRAKKEELELVIAELESQFADLSLELPEFPVFANPLQPIMQDTPLGPTTLNLPSINNEVVSAQVQGSNFNNMTTQQKLDILFGRG